VDLNASSLFVVVALAITACGGQSSPVNTHPGTDAGLAQGAASVAEPSGFTAKSAVVAWIDSSVDHDPSGVSKHQLMVFVSDASPQDVCAAWYDFALGSAQDIASNLPDGKYISLNYVTDPSAGAPYATGGFAVATPGWAVSFGSVDNGSGSGTDAQKGTLTLTTLTEPTLASGNNLSGGEVAGSFSGTLADGTPLSFTFDAVSCSELAPPP
jgi:hypothetical protein